MKALTSRWAIGMRVVMETVVADSCLPVALAIIALGTLGDGIMCNLLSNNKDNLQLLQIQGDELNIFPLGALEDGIICNKLGNNNANIQLIKK